MLGTQEMRRKDTHQGLDKFPILAPNSISNWIPQIGDLHLDCMGDCNRRSTSMQELLGDLK